MSKISKTTSVIVGLATAIWLSGVVVLLPMTARAATVADIQAQINALQSQLTALQGGTGYTFTATMRLGSRGADVLNLQKVLNTDAATKITGTGAGTSGNETSYFGSLTRAAVVKFQQKYGLGADGIVGPISRAKLNALYAGGTPGTPGNPPVTPQGTGLTVTAANQPVATLAPFNASRVPFTRVNFTASSDGDVTVNSLVVERTGLAADATLAGIILLDENGLQLGLEKTLNSIHQVTLTEAFTVKAGQTRTLTIAGNRPSTAGSHGGEIAYLALVTVNTSANINGSLPITGTGQTINETLTIGSITQARGPLDPGTTATKEVGTTGYTFSSIKITAGSAEKVRLGSIRWNQSGSAAKDDLANVKTYVDGVAYDAVVSSDGKYYTSSFGNGLVIDKGFSTEISVKGDIVSGSARTIDFDIYKTTDLYLKGETYGYGISPAAGVGTTAGSFTASQPWYDAYAVTVSAGSLSVSKNTAFSAQNIAVNLADQPLGAFDVEAKGEPVSVASMIFTVASSSCSATAGTGYLTNVSIFNENGLVVSGPVDGTTWTATTQKLTFADTITFPVGKHTYTIKGKVASGSGCVFSVSTTPSASATVASNWTTVKGQNTGITIYPTPYTAVASNAVTVKAGALAISVSTFPLAQTVIAGVTQFTFANYVLDAGSSGEDISLNSIKLNYIATSTTNAQKLTNCELYNGTLPITTGSNAVTPTARSSSTSFTFDAPLTIAKGTTKTLALKCDIAGNTDVGTTWQWGYGFSASTDDATILGYASPMGKVSGQDITETFPAADNGQVMTSATGGTYSVVDDSTPGYSIVSAGTIGVTLLKLKFAAVNEDIDIYKVDFFLYGAAATSSRDDLVGQKLYLYDSANPTVLLGTAQFSQTAVRFASSTAIAPGAFRITAGLSKTMWVKGDIAAINYTQGPLTHSGDLLQVGYVGGENASTNGNYGKGVYSGTTIYDSTTAVDIYSTGVRIMKAYPSVAKIDLSTTEQKLVNGSLRSFYKFSITANGGDVYMYKFTFDVSSSTVQATTTNFGLYAYTDSTFANADSTFTTDGLVNSQSCVNGLNSASSTSAAVASGVYNTVTGDGVQIYPDKGAVCNAATTTYKIPSGFTRYFVLKATVAHTRVTTGTENINVDLRGDAVYPNQPFTMNQAGRPAGGGPSTVGVNLDTYRDFIWSPNSTSSSILLSDLDFTNGYGVPGLPTTNTAQETLTATY